MKWLASYDREAVRGSIEEATGEGLSVEDPLPDTLIAAAQSLGLTALDLRMWIHDRPKWSWSPKALAHWARLRGLADPAAPDPAEAPVCVHCGQRIAGDPAKHECKPRSQSRPPTIHLELDISTIPPERRHLIWLKLAELTNAIAAASGEQRDAG